MLQGVGGAGPLRRAFASSLLLSFPDFLGNVRIVFQRVCRDSVSQCSGRLFDSPFRIGRMLTQETQNGFFSGVVMCMVMMRVSVSFVVVVVVVGSFHVLYVPTVVQLGVPENAVCLCSLRWYGVGADRRRV